MVDLERIAAEIAAYLRALDESATLGHHFRQSSMEVLPLTQDDKLIRLPSETIPSQAQGIE
ncbi:hypothetical protein AB0H51_14035 [Streptomyces griseoluteus]|uniref:hypothetical protein n=1 Tax=Streptomyces griseoluteus TaxID=29306 RepID=UPI003402760B